MTLLRSRLACCTREREISFDFDEQKITTYDGLESCIKQSQSYDNESSTSRCDKSVTDSLFDDDSSSTSSNTAFMSSLSSQRATTVKKDSHGPETWEFSASPQHFCVKEKAASQSFEYSDMEAMRVKFSKLLLGEDMTGGSNGLSTALALSNAISSLSASVFGELWKLEPLSEEKKRKWQQEMEWFLSPTNYMVELVPATQNGNNGSTFEIMTPKARPDIQMNLPALQKLDTMLIETLDSMVETEFWYSEVGSRAEGRSRSAGQSKRWWLPSPQVPMTGLCDAERKKLMDCGKLVNQIFKAAKAINENVLHEMPVPALIKDALPKSAKVNLGEDLYKVLSVESASFDDMIDALNLRSEHSAKNLPLIQTTYDHPEYNLVSHENDPTMDHQNLVSQSFFFGPKEISAIRRKLPPAARRSSKFDVITACIWRSRTRALKVKRDEQVSIACMVNIRNKSPVPLPNGYYGNGAITPAAATEAGRLCHNPLEYAVELVEKAKEKVDEDYVKSVVNFMDLKGRPEILRSERNYVVSDSSKLGFDGVDFGWGKPVYGGTMEGGSGNNSIYAPYRKTDGETGVVVPVFLPAAAMKRFEVELEKLIAMESGEFLEPSKPFINSAL